MKKFTLLNTNGAQSAIQRGLSTGWLREEPILPEGDAGAVAQAVKIRLHKIPDVLMTGCATEEHDKVGPTFSQMAGLDYIAVLTCLGVKRVSVDVNAQPRG